MKKRSWFLVTGGTKKLVFQFIFLIQISIIDMHHASSSSSSIIYSSIIPLILSMHQNFFILFYVYISHSHNYHASFIASCHGIHFFGEFCCCCFFSSFFVRYKLAGVSSIGHFRPISGGDTGYGVVIRTRGCVTKGRRGIEHKPEKKKKFFLLLLEIVRKDRNTERKVRIRRRRRRKL